MVGFEKEIWNRLKYVGFSFALCSVLAILLEFFKFTRLEFLGTLATIGIVLLIIVLWGGFTGITNEMRSGFGELKQLLSKNPHLNPKNPSSTTGEAKEEEKPAIKATGAGAFGGMVLGGLLGLILGPAGVLAGGFVGAIIGDELERDNIRRAEEEREKRGT